MGVVEVSFNTTLQHQVCSCPFEGHLFNRLATVESSRDGIHKLYAGKAGRVLVKRQLNLFWTHATQRQVT